MCRCPLEPRIAAGLQGLDVSDSPTNLVLGSALTGSTNRCAKEYAPIGAVDPANGLRNDRRKMSADQWLRCLQFDDAAVKKF